MKTFAIIFACIVVNNAMSIKNEKENHIIKIHKTSKTSSIQDNILRKMSLREESKYGFEIGCPKETQIHPCICEKSRKGLQLDCSDVKSIAQLRLILMSKFPMNFFFSLKINFKN